MEGGSPIPTIWIKKTDGWGNINSVYYVYNHQFKLTGHTEANKVYVTGSFNEWKEDELVLEQIGDGWSLPIYLKKGIYEYAYLVDGKRITNQALSEAITVTIGNPYIFSSPLFKEAKEVYLAGSFNNWNPKELLMLQTDDQWQYPKILEPGNYQYKFIVDGKWSIDPYNPYQIGYGKEINSVVPIEPNHTFILEGYKHAKKVLLSGTFNNWSLTGFTMEKNGDNWEMPLHLPKGKTQYKFIVDGEWIPDTNNTLWETNQHDSKNSIIWK